MTPVQGLQRWLARLIVAAVAAQVVLAGTGGFGATSFKPHSAIGWSPLPPARSPSPTRRSTSLAAPRPHTDQSTTPHREPHDLHA
jgi:hypothetical protein